MNLKLINGRDCVLLFDFRKFDIKYNSFFSSGKNKLWEKILKQIYKNKTLDFSRGFYGKPFVIPDIFEFNVSNKDDILVIGLSASPIGVDIESLTLPVKYNSSVLGHFFNLKEIAYLKETKDQSELFGRLWSLKEAMVKCKGIGLSFIPESDVLLTKQGLKLSDGYRARSFIYENYIISVIIRSSINNEN
ncbi:4'-phosphopantetheinyl transferase superfamily protein [Streptococcus mutans]|uniref:4'-phosphopantetheinyl transferase family protein n=1 Tax=Streptococcus mutans TaxID=1309 RepID=UPI0002B5B88B|nr:4'-phosphopantetheinyl transferase superfamily protein [Streptococcus mutans]EMB77797.1 Sfp protein [Streptococcus mutans 11VS1]EMC22622.1 Sfp protein [Streptococcus mutans SF1]EMC44632.1 Sfp protein [Streptococcus mutans SM4]EMC57000.1 Sfp protein [Streptococcus mutans M230]AVM72310.1 Sfp protein [Streptococcus mutans]